MSRYARNATLILITVVAIFFAYNAWQLEHQPPQLAYSAFLSQLAKNEIREVHMQQGRITGTDRLGQPFATYAPDTAELIPKLIAKNVEITTAPESGSLGGFLATGLPNLLIIGGMLFFLTRQQRTGRAGGFGKSKAVLASSRKLGVTFNDVAGIPEGKAELMEIVEFLKTPDKFTSLGGRLPKGVLLQGPPGTGKTLLAKAIAGEAGVPFFSISGSDFVEMYVGVGASRVRDLFRQAKSNAPCIIFIDEIDSVGRRRGAGSQSGQDEREQTLNALLVEMDGFQTGDNVVLVAATNRPDVLDRALLRPGRFDRQITIMVPDVRGREEILGVYARQVTMSPEVKLAAIARITPGFSGAELANLVNEAALLAARKRKKAIGADDLEEAKDKIIMGAERKGLVVSEEQRRTTAYHEAGHAILARILPGADPLHKITIIPRGRSMGMTQQMPLDDRHAYSLEYLANRIKILLGGRTAEELVFNQITTGASNDLQTATDIATKMVCEWGMSTVLGPRSYGREEDSLPGGSLRQGTYSEETARAIDREINQLLSDAYQEAVILLEGMMPFLHKLAETLLLHETIDADEVDRIINSSATQPGASASSAPDHVAAA
jgi:cell division protease FtsH